MDFKISLFFFRKMYLLQEIITRIWWSWYYIMIIVKFTWNITPGFSSMTGADISNIVNQAAFQAARAGETEVNMGHLDYAKEKIRDGKSLIWIISLVKKVHRFVFGVCQGKDPGWLITWLGGEINKYWLIHLFKTKQILFLLWPWVCKGKRLLIQICWLDIKNVLWLVIKIQPGSFNEYCLLLIDDLLILS